MKRVRAVVDGEIQRVGYRYFVATLARRYSLRGYVRNQEDGRVEVVAEGDDPALDKFLQEIRVTEPPIAVEKVETEEGESTGEFKNFRIVVGPVEEELVEGFGTGASYLRQLTAMGRENLQVSKQNLQIGKETVQVSKETLQVGKETLQVSKETLQVSKETLQVSKETLEVGKETLQVAKETLREVKETSQEVKGLRQDLKTVLDQRLRSVEEDLAKIKARLGL